MAPVAGSGSPPDLLYGLHPVREALVAGARPLLRVLVVGTDRQFAELVRLARSAGVPVHVEPRPVLDRLVPQGKHQGVVGLIAAKSYADPEEILAVARQRGEAPFVVLLDGVEDPHNLGAILRTADAAGVHGVVLPERRAVGLTGTVAKVSAGALDHLVVARVPNLSRSIDWLKDQVGVHGDVLPRDVLARGFIWNEQRVPLPGPQGIFKPKVLTEIPLSITTAPKGPYDDHFGPEELLRYAYRGTNPQHHAQG